MQVQVKVWLLIGFHSVKIFPCMYIADSSEDFVALSDLPMDDGQGARHIWWLWHCGNSSSAS